MPILSDANTTVAYFLYAPPGEIEHLLFPASDARGMLGDFWR
jgi:hypothetical protein